MRVLPFYGFRILAWVPVLLGGMFDIPSSGAFVHDGLAAAVQVFLLELLEQIVHFFRLAHRAADEDLAVEVLQGGVVPSIVMRRFISKICEYQYTQS